MTEEHSPPWQTMPTPLLAEALSNLSHAFRTPLAAAKGYTTSLIRHDRRLSRAERREMLDEIDRACDRLHALIEQTIQTTTLLQGGVTLQYTVVDLAAVTRQAIATVTQQRPDRPVTTFIITGGDGVGHVWADAAWLTRALVQLLDNARRYSPPDRPITITLRPLLTDAGPLAEWSVTDEGLGMAVDQVPLIFLPFYRVEQQLARTTNGLGLGLPFSQHLIAMHGGDLSVTSAPMQGSRFWFTLPLLAAEALPDA